MKFKTIKDLILSEINFLEKELIEITKRVERYDKAPSKILEIYNEIKKCNNSEHLKISKLCDELMSQKRILKEYRSSSWIEDTDNIMEIKFKIDDWKKELSLISLRGGYK